MRPNHFLGWPVDAGTWFHDRVGEPPRGIRRFDPGDLHVTLAFLGPVEPDDAARAWAALPDLGGPLRITLGDVVPLGRPRRYSALSATLVDGRDAVTRRIRDHRDPLLQLAGREADRRDPLPHVTVARPTRRASDAARAAALDWARGLDLHGVSLTLDRIAWFTWTEDRRGRLFRVVEDRPLR